MVGAVIDLFCGVGGLTHGLILEGFGVLAGIDNDPSCKYAYEQNNRTRFIEKSISEVDGRELNALYPNNQHKILVGCAPCQDFSQYTKKSRTGTKWQLLTEFSRLIREIEPDIISMENVPEVRTFNRGEVFNNFIQSLEQLGYHVSHSVVHCPDYGIPQQRDRLVLFAAKQGVIKIIPPTHTPENYRTVRDVIGSLATNYSGGHWEGDSMHAASRLEDINLRRIQHSVPGGTWADWPEELIAECHKKESGESYGSVYGRMEWDKVAPTITTQCNGYGNGRFGHPEQDRAISLREAALLQTFPRSYQFAPEGQLKFKTVSRQIGNAVPVALGRVIAKSIKRFLEGLHERQRVRIII
uniref:Type II methylase M.HgiDII n=1 Tax=Herpetosiphon aurantiacus TaxID=65 RepID=MTD2_HERAU|nr:RecName: Full=Type II methylase M.HgiDII; Short=M.HgiDII; AltName: Full=Cytosine-specific methyltransferase HgiDII; AltName: Full=Modification methylase HgiDII [Herpetosiphon aurantiacus]CAA38941.1 methyltransferase [Herpetosiphon giganteus]